MFHKNTQKYTFEAEGRDVRSIIGSMTYTKLIKNLTIDVT